MWLLTFRFILIDLFDYQRMMFFWNFDIAIPFILMYFELWFWFSDFIYEYSIWSDVGDRVVMKSFAIFQDHYNPHAHDTHTVNFQAC